MKTSDPRFRSAIANLEKASTGQALRDALIDPEFGDDLTIGRISTDVENPNDDSIAPSDDPLPLDPRYNFSRPGHYEGALPILEISHTGNFQDIDPDFFLEPVIGPGDTLIDFNPEYPIVDQDGNPVEI